MKFGLALPHYDFSTPEETPVSWERVSASASRAEALGFDSVWVSDHFFLSLRRYGGPSGPQGSVETLTALASLAVTTEHVRLGTLVLSAGFRHPALLAKAATTIDLLSGGRLDLGIGAGWYEDEYAAFGYQFGTTHERFEILEETFLVLGMLFGNGPATWRGRHFRLKDAFSRPSPLQQPRPPLWVGGKGGPRLLRLAARHADGWNTVWAWTPDAYAERVQALRRACEREDRDPASMRLSLGLYTLVGEDRRDLVARFRALQRWAPGGALDGVLLDDWARDKLVGTPGQVLERVGEFAVLGVEEMILSAASIPFAVYDESMLAVFAEGVMPSARKL
ncbi:MAG TPA: LLM class flavin-dependent oxidoreductase [Actinomycetota bacterium]|nr:LLM class flavin-dependent oxidoreductase [Actinomycetota bacterium]